MDPSCPLCRWHSNLSPPLPGVETSVRGPHGRARCDRMNRILSVVRSMTDKIIELSRGVVTAPFYGESKRAVGVDQVGTVMLMTRE